MQTSNIVKYTDCTSLAMHRDSYYLKQISTVKIELKKNIMEERAMLTLLV